MKRIAALLMVAMFALCIMAQSDSVRADVPKSVLGRFWYEFNYIDTAYVEPNHYNWAFMLQNTNSMEWLNVSSGQSLRFSPDPMVKIGPYIGWRWLFVGYTFAVNDLGAHKATRTEFEVSLYGSMLGCDLIYRKTGDDFRWRNNRDMEAAGVTDGEYSGGVNVRTMGANIYYLFNHRRFSHPSLFSQSTVQKRSCGSFMLGASITSHKYTFNLESWPDGVTIDGKRDSRQLKYMNYAVSFGYGYNWVIRKNLMLGLSVMPALGYKRISSDSTIDENTDESIGGWIGNNLNVDITARAALVWNNNKYFAGMSAIVHNYNFSHNRLSIHNTFGTLNFYVGLNFVKRKEYK